MIRIDMYGLGAIYFLLKGVKKCVPTSQSASVTYHAMGVGRSSLLAAAMRSGVQNVGTNAPISTMCGQGQRGPLPGDSEDNASPVREPISHSETQSGINVRPAARRMAMIHAQYAMESNLERPRSAESVQRRRGNIRHEGLRTPIGRVAALAKAAMSSFRTRIQNGASIATSRSTSQSGKRRIGSDCREGGTSTTSTASRTTTGLRTWLRCQLTTTIQSPARLLFLTNNESRHWKLS